MDEGKRRLLKALPLAAIAPALMMRVGEREVQGYELAPEKKYVFKLPGQPDQVSLDHVRDTLRGRGINATVIAGDVEIYEMS